jgi:XTP/dITP diphosphohydrolase
MVDKELILATRNKHKVEEISNILKGFGIEIVSLDDFKNVPEVVEDGETLIENASKKARTIAKHLGKWALADDTGLEVDYLKGKPGVYSARWAGPGCSYSDNNKKLIGELFGVPKSKRKAAFKCAIALSSPEGKVRCVEGRINGIIAEKEMGGKGFGYDPLFVVPKYGKSFAQLGSSIKNRISHRALALKRQKNS